jgi:hypothetical protein
MAREHSRPTDEIVQAITSYIRAGGYAHVAAEAAGVPRPVFESWLRRGQEKGARTDLRHFAGAVRQARAQARLTAEIAAFKAKPIDWLRSGPGKETADVPGWTGNVKAGAASGSASGLGPEAQALIAAILDALAPFPEVRTVLAQALIETPETDAV